ncbi:MAG: ABC transporter substrate-binding protein, partial [Chloroflexota bacterium]|nr:ABC transporter substrate-binding protein [Chloroflexota bacterium]
MPSKKQLTVFLILSLILGVAAGLAGAQDPVRIRWYVGLGAGTDAPLVAAQEEVVADFNESQDAIELVLEIVDNEQAYDVLSTQIAAGNAPDIVGPMGIRGRASFPGAWLDLTSLIEANDYDLSDFDPALIDFYRVEGEGQLGIPFAVFPSFLMYNIDLFDEAGIPYPPSAYGETYTDWEGVEQEWNIDTLAEVAKILSVDINGNDATMEEFDTGNIVQFGFGNQFTDVRGRATLFGAANFVDAEGNAVIPDIWREAEHWYHNAMWSDYFIPNAVYSGSEIMGGVVYPFRLKQKNFTTEDTEKIEDTEKRRLYAISLCPSFLCGENEFQPNSIHYRRGGSVPFSVETKKLYHRGHR